MKHNKFNKKQLATAISVLLGASVTMPVIAQEEAADDNTEIIEVRGIRGSLARSMDIKRESSGVVDAISAEEMGKFPDTNLAESLQRITGVTVSRSNNEGSQITVRGFGPDFNLMTLNGRQMPGTGNTRSYSLENLSSEGVSALEVYKTAKASNPSGGLGATVNIITTKPLNSPGEKYSFSAKGIYDESNVEGEDVTPEVAAVYSNTFSDNTVGLAFSVSHQRRDFQKQQAAIDGWREGVTLPDLDPSNVVDNRSADAIGYFFPQNLGYSIEDFNRERTNGQLTLQYAPTDNFTATLDYTASEAITGSESTSFGVWFNFGGNINSYELDERGTVVNFNEAANDYAHTVRKGTTKVEAESIGLNLEWQVSDSWHIELDYHDSSNKIDDGADTGSGNNGFIILGPNNLLSKTYSYTPGNEIPHFELFWPGGAAETTPGDFDSQFAQFFLNQGESNVEQLQIDVEYLPDFGFLPSLAKVEFGFAATVQDFGGTSAFSGNQGVVGYDGVQGILPDAMFTRNDTGSFLDQFAGGGSALLTNYYYTYDYDEAIARHLAYYGDVFQADPTVGIVTPAYVEEETLSFYLQSQFDFDIGEMPAQLNVGFRYEETDVTAPVTQTQYIDVRWQSSTEWITSTLPANGSTDAVGAHDLFLPMVDFKLEITDDLVARASVGKSATRATLGNLLGALQLSPNPKPGARTGSRGNTNLKPFTSTNFDLSLEYYYGEGSYASIGYFKKEVENYIDPFSDTATETVTITVDGLYDIIGGPRYNSAIAAIEGRGETATVEAIYNEIIAGGVGVEGTEIIGLPEDPLVEWTVTQPSNGATRETYGLEVAFQHVFGDSGYGVGVNATFADGDVKFDNNTLDIQFPLPGLGDSANFQAFYEKDGLSAKITYAWRDKYLLGVGQAAGSSDTPPQYFETFGTWDFSINYDVDENLTVFVEGVNINNETERLHGRYEEQFLAARQFGSRYAVGMRYIFE